jgi:Zn-dependent peptidase ImmA (M78 family)
VSPRFPARMLFTLAHELGHLLAHRTSGNGAVFERTSQISRRRAGPKVERFVDAFASILLVPDRGVGRALTQIRRTLNVESSVLGDVEILLLARIFGVSFEVAARRCEDLDLLPEGGAVSLADQLKKDFGSPERRADELGLPPRPTITLPKVSHKLLKAAIEKIEAGELSAGWIADRIGIGIGELFAANAELTSGSQLRH